MTVSRGSIRHSLGEDAWNCVASLCLPARCAAATADERAALTAAVCSRLGASHASLFPYARTGLHAVLRSLRLPPGSEVLLTPITIGPMLEVIVSLGLKPVFIDIELDTFGPDLDDLARRLKRRPAAFLLTYLFGSVPKMDAIVSACADAGTPLIEDFSHAIGASFDGRPLGTFGCAGIYSASLLKYVDGYNGAFVITNDASLSRGLADEALRLTTPDPRRIRRIVQRTLVWNAALNRHVFGIATFPALRFLKAMSRSRFERLLGPSISLDLEADSLPAYYFEDICGLQCRTARRHLARLDDLLASRRRCALEAAAAWLETTGGRPSGCSAAVETQRSQPTFWQFVIPVREVAEARDVLFRKGVETGTTSLMNLAQATGVDLPHARTLKERRIFIPLHANLTRQHYRRMFQALREAGQI